jgi:hypothetical protein
LRKKNGRSTETEAPRGKGASADRRCAKQPNRSTKLLYGECGETHLGDRSAGTVASLKRLHCIMDLHADLRLAREVDLSEQASNSVTAHTHRIRAELKGNCNVEHEFFTTSVT